MKKKKEGEIVLCSSRWLISSSHLQKASLVPWAGMGSKLY